MQGLSRSPVDAGGPRGWSSSCPQPHGETSSWSEEGKTNDGILTLKPGRRLVTLPRMLHDGVGHGTPFVLSTPLARPLACPSMALWDAGRCTVGSDGPRSNGLKESCQRGVRRAGHVRRQIT